MLVIHIKVIMSWPTFIGTEQLVPNLFRSLMRYNRFRRTITWVVIRVYARPGNMIETVEHAAQNGGLAAFTDYSEPSSVRILLSSSCALTFCKPVLSASICLC